MTPKLECHRVGENPLLTLKNPSRNWGATCLVRIVIGAFQKHTFQNRKQLLLTSGPFWDSDIFIYKMTLISPNSVLFLTGFFPLRGA